MTDWYSRAREADGRTDDEVMSSIRYNDDVLAASMPPCPCTCCSGSKWIALGGRQFECRGCGCKASITVEGVPTNG